MARNLVQEIRRVTGRQVGSLVYRSPELNAIGPRYGNTAD